MTAAYSDDTPDILSIRQTKLGELDQKATSGAVYDFRWQVVAVVMDSKLIAMRIFHSRHQKAASLHFLAEQPVTLFVRGRQTIKSLLRLRQGKLFIAMQASWQAWSDARKIDFASLLIDITQNVIRFANFRRKRQKPSLSKPTIR